MSVRGETLTVTRQVDFHVESCYQCGVLFAFPIDLYGSLLKSRERGSFYCPNGHQQHYLGKSDAEKAAEATRAQREAELRLQVERDQRLASERELKRIKQRSKGGACPCCKRSFVQLARHMKTQHPNFDTTT